MTIILPALIAAIAAFCVWLTVRIVNRRERWAKWTLAAIGLPVLYVASFGPACWLCNHAWLPEPVTGWFFNPLIQATFEGPSPIRRVLRNYAEWGAPPFVLTISFDPIGVAEHGDFIFEKLPDDYEPPAHGVLERLWRID